MSYPNVVGSNSFEKQSGNFAYLFQKYYFPTRGTILPFLGYTVDAP